MRLPTTPYRGRPEFANHFAVGRDLVAAVDKRPVLPVTAARRVGVEVARHELVVARPRSDLVDAGGVQERVVAFAAVDRVGAAAAVEPVRPGVAAQGVVTSPT